MTEPEFKPIDLSLPMTDEVWTSSPAEEDTLMPNLDEEQSARVVALSLAQPMMTAKGIGSTKPPDVDELIKLASWIIDGSVDPLYPYESGDTFVLGPGITVALDGSTIFWDTTAYHKEEVDEL